LPTSSLRRGQGPHSGDDTYDLIDHALHQLTERRGAWPDIAQALATNPDGASRRFDPDSPVADGRWPYDT
jgi:hypothetical protein